ncbi:3-deoxy-D-manno-octulosonic acid transferase [Thiosocius teredinicola]|uniref:3-deoxy-D-manno-octulosonic acid transferase n=1 Tax=Thiosocius teredinicola TaxID=1973002 RepID=UPI000990F00C
MARPATHRSSLSLGETARWSLFRLLETLSKQPSVGDNRNDDILSPGGARPAVWVFASTIGELNAVAPFLKRLTATLQDTALVFISDHEHYRDTYLGKYPQAYFFSSKGATADALRLAQAFPPRQLYIAEIPCLLSDAPCRFSYAFLRTAKQHNAKISIINGWLYEQAPTCRLDAWERRLLLSDYLAHIDHACVQTPHVAERMVSAGMAPARIVVTGNMKFDAIDKQGWSAGKTRSPIMLGTLLASARPVLVAGCLKKPPEQAMIIEAFLHTLQSSPQTLLVVAHRHPEVPGNIERLSSALDEAGIGHVRRSKAGDAPVPPETQCLILDTMGELRDFYAAATIAHVGADHNLLEPLGFDKPVTTVSTWHAGFPNYPVFEMMKEVDGIVTVADAEQLGTTWAEWLGDPASLRKQQQRIQQVLLDAAGATQRTAEATSLA